jgi:hypothetical protein
MIREPAFELSLVPFVVGYMIKKSAMVKTDRAVFDLPALLNQVLAVAVDARPSTRRLANFILGLNAI